MAKTTPTPPDHYRLEVRFGHLCDPLAEQLKKQKLKYDKEQVRMLQDDIDAYLRLKLRSLISRVEADQVSKRLFKAVQKQVSLHN